jgi:hypothetical protein
MDTKTIFTPTRRNFLRGGLAAVAVGTLGTSTWLAGSASAATAPFLPYTADSFFKSTVAGSPVDAVRTLVFKAFMKSNPDQKSIAWPKVNVNADWASTHCLGKASDPVWKLTGGNTSNSKLAITRTQGFHMSDTTAALFPTGTQDRPGVMVDPVFGYTVQFADGVVNKANRTIAVSNAAVFWHSSNGLDYRNPKSNDSRNMSSRGRIIDSQVIRPDLLAAAIANGTGMGHVLHLFFVETKSADGMCHPMTGAESSQVGFGAEGERIAIRSDVNLVARGLTGGALALARTLQTNGAYIGDNSGSSTQLKGQSGGYPGTNVTTDCLQGKITWDDFYVLPKGWQ